MTALAAVSAPGLFVYYRVRREHLADAVAAVRALQARWQALDAALQCELLRRSDDAGADVTLMEIFRRDTGFDAVARRHIEDEAGAALAPWLTGPRHVEAFEPCA